MTDEVINNPSEKGPASFSPMGEVFASARNAKKLELKDVSNNLRLSIKQIEALENNDFDGLPQPMITRGFIRNYARFLELDAEPLLESYRSRVPEVLPSALNVQSTSHRISVSRNNQPKLKFGLVIALVLLMLLAWFLYTNFIPKMETEPDEIINESSVNSSNTEAVVLPEVALPAAERLPESVAIASEDVENSADLYTTSPNTPQTNLKATVDEVITQGIQLPKEATLEANALKENIKPTVPTSQTASATEVKEGESMKSSLKVESSIAGNKSVSISVIEQTWVRASDKTGAVVYEKILQPNTEDGFNGLAPFKVLIGNVKGTKLTFSGQPVDLTDKTKNNVAHVTLE